MRRVAISALLFATTSACASGAGAPEPSMPPVDGETKAMDGLRYLDVSAGTGATVERNRCAYVHYTAWRSSGRQVETSRAGEPAAFVLGIGQVMRGWDIGIAGMKVGGLRRLLIPSQLAYGEKGNPPLIPPGTALVFDVEVMAVGQAIGTAACPSYKDVR